MFNLWIALAANMVCISVLVYAVYFPRYQRRDLAIAYVCLNVGIMLVTMLMSGSGAGMGLGLGLFGVLSIIRLRSDTLTQGEIGYYFAALVLGLMNGLHPDPVWLSPVLSVALVAVLFLADHPRIAPRTRRQTVTLDRAYAHEGELRKALEVLLGGNVMRIEVMELDTVRDLTVVDVRYKAATTPATTTTATQTTTQTASAAQCSPDMAGEFWASAAQAPGIQFGGNNSNFPQYPSVQPRQTPANQATANPIPANQLQSNQVGSRS